MLPCRGGQGDSTCCGGVESLVCGGWNEGWKLAGHGWLEHAVVTPAAASLLDRFCGGEDGSDEGDGAGWCWLLSEEERRVVYVIVLEREVPNGGERDVIGK